MLVLFLGEKYLKVLLVEDNLDLLNIYKESIEDELQHVIVSTAKNGNEAIGLIDQEQFDLVISDYTMPGKNGGEVFLYLRGHKNNCAFLLVTGEDIEGDRPSVGADGTRSVGADTNYEQWLRKQPKAFQEEVLGIAKAKLFRDGKISIGRFVDEQGRVLSLDQLRELEPLAFERAGL